MGHTCASPPTDNLQARVGLPPAAVKDWAAPTSTVCTPPLSVLRQRGTCATSPCRKQEADFAAGLPKRQHISLCTPGNLSSWCCCVPGVLLFSMMFMVVSTGAFAPDAFYTITALLMAFSMVYTSNLSLGCIIGAGRMRRDCNKDWQSLLSGFQKGCPDGSADVMHIVILPNYQEDEAMMLETLENLGRAPLARGCMHVVLAMEDREGPSGRLKAERLISQASHLFAGLIATYHPKDIPGELAGKSSNCQWAYSEALRSFALDIAKLPASRVFLTVGDADTLWHPQFFSAMSYQALQLPAHEREWSFWQPPVLLMRNLFSVPQLTRISGYGTILFELAGLVNTWLSNHFCYSAYSLTLAMAAHPMVGGWDTDVIAEDHHMFCKCYFAALWEQVENKQNMCGAEKHTDAVKPKVQIRPVYLPAISYLVEDDKGWWSSCFARFQQARRHSQGIAELSYVGLQHAKLFLSAGSSGLPMRTHAAVVGIASKMFTVHVINQVQAFSLIVAGAVLARSLVPWVMSGGLGQMMEADFDVMSQSAFGFLHSRLVRIAFGAMMTPGFLLTCFTTFWVVRDVLEGHYTQVVGVTSGKNCKEQFACTSVAPAIQGAALAKNGSQTTRLSLWRQIRLCALITSDYISNAEMTLVAYGLVPVSLAAWSLMRSGPRFEYVVAAKPK